MVGTPLKWGLMHGVQYFRQSVSEPTVNSTNLLRKLYMNTKYFFRPHLTYSIHSLSFCIYTSNPKLLCCWHCGLVGYKYWHIDTGQKNVIFSIQANLSLEVERNDPAIT